MPLIIPPVRRKTYAMFGSLFRELWLKAEDLLAAADEVIVIGYSFPETDVQSTDLFRTAFRRRRDLPRITILDPKPDRAAEKFRTDFGVPSNRLKIFREYFSPETEIESLFW
jgi:hypothetical protein